MSDIGDHKYNTFHNQIGITAKVERETASVEKGIQPNRMLANLGIYWQEHDDYLKHFRYMGSAAVHIFWNDTLLQVSFVNQTQPLDLYGCPSGLASKAFDDLLHTMKAQYNGRRSRLRSGF